MGMKVAQTQNVVIAGGEYAARITDIKEKTDGEYGLAFAVEFTLHEGKVGHKMTKFVSQKFSPKSRLYELARAVRGAIPKSYDLDTDDLLGEEVVVSIVKELDDAGDPFNKIVGFLPVASRGDTAAAETAQAEPAPSEPAPVAEY